ncbi:hypothetical protein ASG72_17950 [Bosea sp. Leaf344]|uniref:hypothetical protein n=1 Tax=Bosea sp. Leaf344 TaxID=1736346 RepID=UPI0007157766|nr:hypothetical protein [Bosea sp. Leaf344]KQU49902.1 hypothetical protein ASG72_17950 [Bosea sp. Leaf344]
MQVVDDRAWPLVRLTVPKVIADDEADAVIAALEAVIARGSRFALIFDGPERPEASPRFDRLYREWSRRRRGDLGRLVLGAVRIERDETRRRAMLGTMLDAALAAIMPYPFKVVGSEAEAQQMAEAWLEAGP